MLCVCCRNIQGGVLAHEARHHKGPTGGEGDPLPHLRLHRQQSQPSAGTHDGHLHSHPSDAIVKSSL